MISAVDVDEFTDLLKACSSCDLCFFLLLLMLLMLLKRFTARPADGGKQREGIGLCT